MNLYEIKSFNHGKVHAIVASTKEEAIRLLAENVFTLKVGTKLLEHQEKCVKPGCGCEHAKEEIIAQQIAAYEHRQISRKGEVEGEARVIARNTEPMPEKSQMN